MSRSIYKLFNILDFIIGVMPECRDKNQLEIIRENNLWIFKVEKDHAIHFEDMYDELCVKLPKMKIDNVYMVLLKRIFRRGKKKFVF